MQRRIGRRYVLITGASLLGTSLAWGASTTGVTVTVGGETGGRILATHPLTGDFKTVHGAAQIVEGIPLFQIEYGRPQLSDRPRIEVILMNPQDVGQVLHNPNAYIDVAIWYPEDSENEDTEHLIEDKNDEAVWVRRDDDTRAEARLRASKASSVVRASESGHTTAFIVARITVPGGPVPHHPQLTTLEFGIGTVRT